MADIPRFDISQDVSMLFGSLLVVHDWPDSDKLNDDLAEILLAREKSTAKGGMHRSNAGGWQSPGNLIDWPEAPIRELKKRIETLSFNLTDQIIRDDGSQRSFRLLLDAWGNINRSGDYNVVHAHPNCMWSGCYYVGCGEPDTSIAQNGLLSCWTRGKPPTTSRLPTPFLMVVSSWKMFPAACCYGLAG